MGLAGATLGCTTRGERRLNIYNWENYVAASTIPDFEREFRCRVRYATYGAASSISIIWRRDSVPPSGIHSFAIAFRTCIAPPVSSIRRA